MKNVSIKHLFKAYMAHIYARDGEHDLHFIILFCNIKEGEQVHTCTMQDSM